MNSAYFWPVFLFIVTWSSILTRLNTLVMDQRGKSLVLFKPGLWHTWSWRSELGLVYAFVNKGSKVGSSWLHICNQRGTQISCFLYHTSLVKSHLRVLLDPNHFLSPPTSPFTPFFPQLSPRSSLSLSLLLSLYLSRSFLPAPPFCIFTTGSQLQSICVCR